MVCALPLSHRTRAPLHPIERCAHAPLALEAPLTSGAWALACTGRRPDLHRHRRRRRRHQRRSLRRLRCPARAFVDAHVDAAERAFAHG